jgi:hypothetical protein
MDMIAGIFLAASPWIFGFADYVWAPHVIVGVGEVLVVALSKTVPTTEKRHNHAHTTTTAH